MSDFDWGTPGSNGGGASTASAFDWGNGSGGSTNAASDSNAFDWGNSGTTQNTNTFDWGAAPKVEAKQENVYGDADTWATWQDEATSAAVVTKESSFFQPEESKEVGTGALQPVEHDSYSAPNALSPQGGIFTVGLGDCEQLGTGVLDIQLRYKPVPALQPPVSIVRIAAGAMHTLALAANGELWSWGINDAGALGRDGEEGLPGKVQGLGSSPIMQVPLAMSLLTPTLASQTCFACT